jgi:hypothetical protein
MCASSAPVAVAIVLAVIEPSYFRPMFSTTAGLVVVAASVIAVAFSLALAEVSRRLTRPTRGRLLAGLGLILLAVLVQFSALWIVLLGPALLIVLNTQQP